MFFAADLSAQVARVFLSGTGNDLNDCSDATTPCRSLQGAVNQCPVNGEVIVMASGGSTAVIRVTNSTITNNTLGLWFFGGTITSYSTNQLWNNATDGTFTATVSQQ